MGRNKKIEDIIEKITQITLEEVMHKSMMPYAEHVILERALPRAEDGLKPVQRRILYTMYELGLTPDKPYRKCARIVGDCLGKYHPHGDSSVYDALARMAQDFAMNGRLVDGHGNFGSIDGDSPAAMRYTEARMTSLSLEMLRDLNKNTVPFVLNFEDELQEPDVLPSRYPNLLVNGSSGIAVGLATNIPPHNLNETISATIAMLKNPDISTDELMNYIIGPDFPTGGELVESDEIKQAYTTGKGKLKLRAKTTVEDSSSGRKLIVINEVPYQVSKANLLEKIQDLVTNKKMFSDIIYSIRDESDRMGMRAIIEIKKDVDVNKALALLYKYSDMETTFGVNLVAIADGKPKQLSLKDLISCYITHQKNVITNRTKYDVEKSKIRAHILEGLIIALDNIDKVIKIIKESKNPKTANINLCEAFGLSQVQSQAILDMRLQRLTNLEIISIKDEYNKLLKLIKHLEAILSSEKKLIQVIVSELEEISQNNIMPRKTQIIQNYIPELPTIIETTKVENATIIFSGDYKIQRYLNFNINSFDINSDNIDISNIIINRIDTDTAHKLLIITNLGNCFVIDIDSIPLINKKSDRGLMLNALISGYGQKERALGFFPISQDITDDSDILIITKSGLIKRTNIKEYAINRSKFIGIKLKKNDEIAIVLKIENNNDMLLISHKGQSIRFSLSSINNTGRITSGVSAIHLEKDDIVIFAESINESKEILIVTDKGYAKRIPFIDFERQNRGGKGVRCINLLKNMSNGSIISEAISIQFSDRIVVEQKKSPYTIISTDAIPIQKKDGKGIPCVLSVLDDIVTHIYCLNSECEDSTVEK